MTAFNSMIHILINIPKEKQNYDDEVQAINYIALNNG